MSRAIAVLAMAVVGAGVGACSESPDNPVAPTPAALSKVAGDAQSATVLSAVPVPPSVLVEDRYHDPVADVTVEFAVTAGGGSVTSARATTDSLGIATVGSWVLGRSAGPNTLVATVSGVDSVVFSATGTPGPVARLAKADAGLPSATVGTAVVVPPAVRVTDAYDNAVGGITVTFAVTLGDGTANGTTAVTDSLGVARVGAWTLGTTAGLNILSASVDGLSSLDLLATGFAGPAISVTKVIGDGQIGGLLSPVDTAPTVLVTDVFGNPVPGVSVAFSITAGDGTIGQTTTLTGSLGTATVGVWTLGPSAGVNVLSAAVTGLPEVTFTALAVDRCTEASAYSIGSTVDGALYTADCRLPSGEFTDFYSASLSATSSVRFDMASPAFSSHVSVFDGTGALLATTPYWCGDSGYCEGTNSVHVLLAAGDYVVGAGGFQYDYGDMPVGGVVGPYSFSSTAVAEDVRSCSGTGPVFVVPGVSTAQRIESTDCPAPFRSSTYYSDQLSVYLTAGRTYTITMSSAEFDTYLQLWLGPWGDTVAFNDDFGGTSDSRITFTPTTSGLYVIVAATYDGDTTGNYTLTIQ